MRQKSKSGLFLMELIIAILFFSISAVICIQLFVASYSISRKSETLNAAMLQAQTAAEYFRAADGDIDSLCGTLPLKQVSENEYICYFDKNGVFDTRNFSDYAMKIVYSKPESNLGCIDISVYSIDSAENGGKISGEAVFTLTAVRDIPRTVLQNAPEVSEDAQ